MPKPTISAPARTCTVSTNPDESIVVCINDSDIYEFRAPRGRDLSQLRAVVSSEQNELELLAHLLSTLQKAPKLTADQWLDDVSLYAFTKVGEAVNAHFQL